jgi:release factor glutamine methyltransferase
VSPAAGAMSKTHMIENSVRFRERSKKIKEAYNRQPYETEIESLKITICKGVFPSDLAFTTRYLVRSLARYSASSALDMGCGTGIIALAMKRNGIRHVWAVDDHVKAIDCTKLNIRRHADLKDIIVLRSNLFDAVPRDRKFDLIVFNHPYKPSESGAILYGKTGEGGRALIERFFRQLKSYIVPTSVILMPFSTIVGQNHDPAIIADRFGLKHKIIDMISDAGGEQHYIYELTLG